MKTKITLILLQRRFLRQGQRERKVPDRGRVRENAARRVPRSVKKVFHADGKIPDSLLFTAPQWNTCVELTYNQNQRDILAYARSILKNGFKPGVPMVDDTWRDDLGVRHVGPATLSLADVPPERLPYYEKMD